MGELDDATNHYMQCIKNEGEVASQILVGVSCAGLSKVRYQQGWYHQAAQLGAFADALISKQNVRSELDESFYAPALLPARARLQDLFQDLQRVMGADAYTNAVSTGYQLTLYDKDNLIRHIINV